MAVVAVVGGPGAPGATTTALALLLSWPLRPGRRILLVECDPDGGAVLAGALEGRVEAVYGLRNLAVADRRGLLAQTIWEQLLDISPQGNGERLLLPGLTDPAQAPGLAYTWEPLVEALHALEPLGYDVLLDLGRNGAAGSGAVLARRADAVVVVVRNTLRGLSSVRPRLAALREDLEANGTGADALGLLVIGEGPYPVGDVARELAVPALGVLPHVPRTARVLSDGGDTGDRRFIRSELMRTARTAADRVQELVAVRRRRLGPAVQGAAAAAEHGGTAAAGGYARPAATAVGHGSAGQAGYGGPVQDGQVGYGTAAAQVGAVVPGEQPGYGAMPAQGGGVSHGGQVGYGAVAASAGGAVQGELSGYGATAAQGGPVGYGAVAAQGGVVVQGGPVAPGGAQVGYGGGAGAGAGAGYGGYGPAPQAVLPQPPGGDGQPLAYAPHIAPPAVPQPPAPAPFPVQQQGQSPSSSDEPRDGWGEVLRAR